MSSVDRLPSDRNLILHISGGRTSGMMLRLILDAHGGRIPDNAVAIFANTGKEREETLVFLREMEERWRVDIQWLEFTYREHLPGGRSAHNQKNWFRAVDFNSANRTGRPFEELIRSRKMLPTVTRRLCTAELKVNTAARFVRWTRGWTKKNTVSVLGIRYDEPKRWRTALFEECHTIYPLVDAKATVEDVNAYWRQSPFDLGIHGDKGNCDLCFLKGVGKLRRLMAEEPERAQWWIDMERFRARNTRKTLTPEMQQFLKNHSYAELLATRGEEAPAEDDRPVSCFCGD